MSPSETSSIEGLERLETFDRVAESFLERIRRGERPSLAEYTARYPEMASEIRELLPMLVEMELAKSAGAGAVTGSVHRDAGTNVGIPQQLGNYRILARIGEGGMGFVYEAIQEGLGRHVALKVIRPEFLADPGFLDRFRREAQAAAQLHHPHIVPVFDAGACNGIPYFAMQYIAGQSLAAVLEEVTRLRSPGPDVQVDGQAGALASSPATPDSTVTQIAERLLTGQIAMATPTPPVGETTASVPRIESRSIPPARPDDSALSVTGLGDPSAYFRVIARLGAQVAGALAFAHDRGILHRDVKPANLLLGLDGHVWVGDFGLAKVVEGGDASRSQDLAGTPRFMAPERFDGWSDRRSDVYALGVTLYEMATLRPAFPARDRAQLIHQILHDDPARPRRLDRRIPRDLETIICKAMAREPSERYRSAADLAGDLDNFLTHRPIAARRNPLHERAWKWCRRKPALAGLWLALALGLAATSWQWWRAEQSLGRVNRMAMGLALDRAITLCEQGEPARGTLQMVDLLRSAALSAPEYDHAIRANLTSWARMLPRPVMSRALAGVKIINRYVDDPISSCEIATVGNYALVLESDRVEVFDLGRFDGPSWFLASGEQTSCVSVRARDWAAITARRDGVVQAWDIKSGARLGAPVACRPSGAANGEAAPIRGVMLNLDGTRVATINQFDEVRIWDTKSGLPTASILQTRGFLRYWAFSPDGRHLVTWAGMNYQLWDVETGRRLLSREIKIGQGMLLAIYFRPDSKVFATGAEHATRGQMSIRLWDLETGAPIGQPLIHRDRVLSVGFTPDSKIMASLESGGRNRLWDAATGKPIAEPFWQRHATWGANAFRKHSEYYTIDSSPGTFEHQHLLKWQLSGPPDGEMIPGAELKQRPPSAISQDGMLYVTGSNDGRLVVRAAVDSQPTGIEMHHRDAILAVAISPDGRRVASGSADGTGQIWDSRTGRSVTPPLSHQGPVRSISFRSDGSLIATGSEDGTARLWDGATGTRVGPSLPHPGPVVVVAFDEQGFLLTRASDGLVRRWAIPPAAACEADEVLLWLQALTGAELSPEGIIRKIPDQDTRRWEAIRVARERGVASAP
jgi:serine/threonine protein kinase/WD40 repeat protein